MAKISSESCSDGKIMILQPALPRYRLDLFDKLSQHYGSKFSVIFSRADLGRMTNHADLPKWAFELNPLHKILGVLEWQPGVLKLPVSRCDIVVVCGAPRCITTIILLLKCKVIGAKTIWWGHYWSSTSRQWRFLIRLKLMNLSNALLFYTDKEVERYRSLEISSAPTQVSALNNGLDIEPISQLREYYKAIERDNSILFIGRLESKAKLDLLFKAMSFSELSKVSVHVIGSGSLLLELRTLGNALGISHRITWHGDLSDEERISKVANTCRAFVYPGEVGLSLIHAMGYGLPSVVHQDHKTHMPEFAAFIEDETGRSFAPNDPVSLCTTISNLLESPKDLERMSKKSIKIVSNSFNTKVMAQRFVSIIDNVT